VAASTAKFSCKAEEEVEEEEEEEEGEGGTEGQLGSVSMKRVYASLQRGLLFRPTSSGRSR